MAQEGDDDSSQELRNPALEPFNCSICLELLYKPVVHACGHMFCFWCTFHAMDFEKQSLCPVCRQPYMYFPRPCKLLHLVLSKAFPEEYKRRAHEIQCEEEKQEFFSPCFPESLQISQIHKEVTGSNSEGRAAVDHAVMASSSNASVGINELCNFVESLQQKDFKHEERDPALSQGVLSVDDFCCSACNNLLYRPVVLNCGDVFCETCLKTSNPKNLQCPSCRASHPGGSVCICLELHQFLESSFPAEYMRKHVQLSEENSMSIDYNTANVGDCKTGGLHEGVGCDSCGMFPIIGDRYSCDECMEKIGFDLCSSCYNSGGSLLGRFNQNHQLNHRMRRVDDISGSCTTE